MLECGDRESEDLHGRDEAEAEKESETSADAADERNLRQFLLRHESRHVRVLDVHPKLDQVVPAVDVDLPDERLAQVSVEGLKPKVNFM